MARIVIGVVLAAIFGVGVFAIWAWIAGDDDPPKLDNLQMLLAERAVDEVVTKLAEQGLPKGVDTLTTPVLTGKKGPELAKLLRPQLAERGWNLVDESTLKKDYPKFSRVFETAFGDAAAKWVDDRWKAAGVHGFVRGSAVYVDRDGATALALKVRVEDSGSGATLVQQESTQDIVRSIFKIDYYRLTIDEMSAGWRMLLWLVALLLLPLCCYPLAAKGLAAGRNSANLALWLGFTFVNMVFASALMGFRMPGFFGAFGMLIALALALFYNYGILTEIDDLRK